MSKIFIYYSLTGNGDLVADFIRHKYDVLKLETSSPIPKSGFFKFMSCGFKAALGFRDPLINFDIDLNLYDEIIVGSPIWNSRLCSPINTLLDKLEPYNKKIDFILYSGSGKAKMAVKYINKKYDSKIIILKEPKSNPLEINKVKELL